MRLPTWLGFGLIALFAAGAALAQKIAETPTFRTSVEMVLIPVTVTDASGKTVEGLRANDFTIIDNQRPQTIVSFSSDDAPCSIGLVLDVSGSMRPTLSGAKEIAQALFGSSNPDDEFLLLTVSTQPASTMGFTSDTAALEESIALARPGGQTALIDTIYLGLSRMREAQLSRRALVIVSDGMDNHSRHSQQELTRMALESDVQIYTILVENDTSGSSTSTAPYRPSLVTKPWNRAEERQGPEMLQKLSELTGGLYFRASDNAEAKEAIINVARAVRDEYVIGYHFPDSASGRWHRVRVKLNVPKANPHARTGYYSY